MSKLVQLKPYNPRSGHLLRRWAVAEIMFSNEAPNHWVAVDDARAAYCSRVRNGEGPNGPKAFFVKTYPEAKRIEEASGRLLPPQVIADYIRLGGTDVPAADAAAAASRGNTLAEIEADDAIAADDDEPDYDAPVLQPPVVVDPVDMPTGMGLSHPAAVPVASQVPNPAKSLGEPAPAAQTASSVDPAVSASKKSK